jgi:hypothetical protein
MKAKNSIKGKGFVGQPNQKINPDRKDNKSR